MKKNLVYYCVGKENVYFEMLKFSIFTLKNKNSEIDILIITNDENVQIENKIKNVEYFYVNEPNPKKLKTKIFQYPNLKKYSKIIYLDCDIVVNTLMYRLFDLIVDKNKLYVPAEQYTPESHNLEHFGLGNYTQEELDFFAEKEIYPFNSGTFGFFNNSLMKKRFEIVEKLIEENSKNSKFTDQPSMNMFFCQNLLTDYNVFKHGENYFFVDWNDDDIDYSELFDGIYHFYSYSGSIYNKLKKMIIFYFINKK